MTAPRGDALEAHPEEEVLQGSLSYLFIKFLALAWDDIACKPAPRATDPFCDIILVKQIFLIRTTLKQCWMSSESECCLA